MIAKEIELHPGHWKNTGSGANGILNEVTEARKVTKRVYEILRFAEVPATYYEDNSSVNQRDNINTIIKHHNADRDGLIVSIHFNAGGDGSKPIGTEVLYTTQKDIASKVAKAISDASGLKNRGAKKRSDLGVLARTYEPAILIEVCFVNSVVDSKLYRDNFEVICQAISRELAAAIGHTLKMVVSPPANSVKSIDMKESEEIMLTATGRNAIRDLLKKARNKMYTVNGKSEPLIDPNVHTDAKINQYNDAQLVSYQAAVINRTFQ